MTIQSRVSSSHGDEVTLKHVERIRKNKGLQHVSTAKERSTVAYDIVDIRKVTDDSSATAACQRANVARPMASLAKGKFARLGLENGISCLQVSTSTSLHQL
jgi:hypothetical protein